MGTSTRTRRASARTKAIWALFLATAICLLAPASALAAASYLFEPKLSLTGDCSTSGLDPVPDPGTCPGTPKVDHPSSGFENPGVTTDLHGNVYVANISKENSRIDVFDSEGFFITELADPAGAQSIAVDSEGSLYVFERLLGGEHLVRRFPPSVYKPDEGEIEYASPPEVLVDESTKPILSLSTDTSVAVDPTNDRLYLDHGQAVSIFKSAKEGGGLLEEKAISGLSRSTSIAIDAAQERIYVSDRTPIVLGSTIRVFELKAPHAELKEAEIDGSTTPAEEFISLQGALALDVDEDVGHVFVGDFSANKVYEFEEDGAYLATIEHSFNRVPFGEIAVDDGPFSPRPQTEGWLFVPSGQAPSLGHVYAFEPKEQGPPDVEATSVGDITDAEATLAATINPHGLPTEYRLEYVTQQRFEESAWAEASIAGQGTLPKGAEGKAVSAAATGLEPGASYRFRAIAENEEGEDEEGRAFKTFEVTVSPPCANDALRTGFSGNLPDCRAYELVTPPDTNGRPPSGPRFAGVYFPTFATSSDGSRVSFLLEGGALPGTEGTGALNGDRYLATRHGDGWGTEPAGPNGEEASAPTPGSASPDQTYSFWESAGAINVRYPDGHSELVGRGSLGTQSHVEAKLISENGGHILFATLGGGGAVQLEPDAPPSGTGAVYDRTADEVTHVVSLLPGDETPKAGENAKYLGSSEDGEAVAFGIGGAIYVRLHNTETLEVAGPGSVFAGISEEGKRVFYLEGGDLFAFDAATEEAIAFSESGDVTPVNVATAGARAYFVSPSVLTGEPNPNGEEAKKGAENLYLSEEGTIRFVGTVTERDVEGEDPGTGQVGGLGLWVDGIESGKPAKDPSRTTPAGTTLLFETRADLTGFESEGFAQVYRYDSAQGRLDCLSCSPTGLPPSTDASLQSIAAAIGDPEPGSGYLEIRNLRSDGHRAFFQTAEQLVVGDADGLLDVYEWEEDEVGSCEKPDGCIYLISGGHSASPDYLFAVSSSGEDVFLRTSDLLLARDAESTLSLYDARVGGGFPEPKPKPPCEGDGCRPVTSPPQLSPPTTGVAGPSDNPPPKCHKGKRAVKRHGKVVCVRKHSKKAGHHRRAGSGPKGGAK